MAAPVSIVVASCGIAHCDVRSTRQRGCVHQQSPCPSSHSLSSVILHSLHAHSHLFANLLEGRQLALISALQQRTRERVQFPLYIAPATAQTPAQSARLQQRSHARGARRFTNERSCSRNERDQDNQARDHVPRPWHCPVQKRRTGGEGWPSGAKQKSSCSFQAEKKNGCPTKRLPLSRCIWKTT